ncbi:hypothetical protein C8A00DRAFT_43640 [Chaetomidium leptoderma]|uniref:FAD-binding domain-containing protein n=1 Tax=Chaetomidium leptoderma TaxID=669021 RepID=A0AAN6VMF0_9PEZI|nr:hypothetical protein C8A00DRAFT_43640 [Chaetomidium leptoderma]
MPPPRPNLAIIGAGITGTTLSIALTARSIPHTVYEQSPSATELGAGLGFGPNAARAMKIIDPALWETFMRVSTRRDLPRLGGDPEKEAMWIEFLDGTLSSSSTDARAAFGVVAGFGEGHGAVHRAKWLEVLMGMVPEGVVRFGKRLEGIVDGERGGVVLTFEDGITAEADAVVGCDGVKSKVREIMVGGRESEGARCGYSGKYAYRCMIPMDKAVEEIGRERAGVSSLWMGHGRHVLTFPVGKPGPDQLLNLVAFVTDSNESWPSKDARSLALPATREDALQDFEQGGFGKSWALFDLADAPLKSFYSGRILVIGDAAHASTPHHGSGAGFCMEDVAVLSSLLEDPNKPDTARDLEAVFAAFDGNRRERDQWLVESSRRAADLYEWRLPNTGKENFEGMKKDIEDRQAICWGIDLDKAIREAKADLRQRTSQATKM